jgi:hypothetical protein
MPKFEVPVIFDTVQAHSSCVIVEAQSKDVLLNYLDQCNLENLCRVAAGKNYLNGEVVLDSVDWCETDITEVEGSEEAEMVAEI